MVRQRSAKPPSSVQLRSPPPITLLQIGTLRVAPVPGCHRMAPMSPDMRAPLAAACRGDRRHRASSSATETHAGSRELTMPHSSPPNRRSAWQAPSSRRSGQASPFSVSMSPQRLPGAASTGPLSQVLHSATSICRQPTLGPFARELPADCDWWAGARWRCCTGRAPGRGQNRATSTGLTWQDRPGVVVDGALSRE